MIDPCAEVARIALAGAGASIGAEALGRKIDVLADLLTKEQLGRKVSVSGKDGRNVFHPIQV
jgi:hypothetical protein